MSCLNLDERMALLPGVDPRRIIHEMPWSVHDHIVATAVSRERLRRWANAGCPSAEVGDVRVSESGKGVREQVTAALGRIPAPVLYFLAQRCAILGLGEGVGGCCCVDTDLGGRILLVVTAGRGDPEEVQTLTAHEAAHAWLHGSDELLEAVSISAHEQATDAIESFAGEYGLSLEPIRERREAVKERVELEATALCRAWGFRGVAAYHNRRHHR